MSIADLLARQGDIIAAGRRENGRIYGQLGQQLGAIPAQTYAAIAAQRQNRQAEDMGALQLKGLQGQIDDRAAQQAATAKKAEQVAKAEQDRQIIDAAMAKALTQNPDGTVTFNRASAFEGVPQTLIPRLNQELDAEDLRSAGLQEKKAQILKSATDQRKASEETAKIDAEHWGEAFAQIKAAKPEQRAALLGQALAYGHAHGFDTQPFASDIMNGRGVNDLIDSYLAGSTSQRELAVKEVPKTPPVPQRPVQIMRNGVPVWVKPEESYGQPAPLTAAGVATQAANAPQLEVNANRPDAKTANVIDPATGLTPNAIYQGSIRYALEEKLPPLGRQTGPQAKASQNAMINKASALAAAAGTTLSAVKADYAAYAPALRKFVERTTFNDAAMGTANDNLQLALDQSANVPRTSSAFVNRYKQWAQGELTDAKNLSKLETYIYTAAREYAKVTSGAAQSVAGLTDSASKEAEKLLNAAKAPQSFASVIGAMQDDMRNVQANNLAEVNKISTVIGRFLSAATGIEPKTGGGLDANTTHEVTQGNIRYRVTTDASGKVINSEVIGRIGGG